MPFSSWLYRIAHNQVVDYFRKKSRRATVPLDESIAAGEGDPGQVAERKLEIEELALATKKLTAAQQEVISLRFAGELSVAEVARVMGRSVGAVKALQHSAIVSLRKVLSAGVVS
jgi:RNA polymerase sigma-70 factor (ECF subfamily)